MKERVILMHAKEEGREEGENRLLIRQICRKMRKGMGIHQIAEDTEVDETRIGELFEIIKKYAPDYDEEKVLGSLGLNKAVVTES